ncbi:uncharacterized protein LOC119684870 [Teleopsis dalmanni]|uniref:uncharacterized protein LOC119684870 n=1 Tax=Teleopsis dalmanni TaxID=139649 RepID=UPI0018CDD374|nr:uncharacterized protein LOC119684870 [Teleopsis dalmanni]
MKILLSLALLCAAIAFAERTYAVSEKSVEDTNVDAVDAQASNIEEMTHNENFDMIMPDYFDQHPAASMQYQNFEKFFDPQMTDNNNEYKMDESRIPLGIPMRAPQPLSPEEERIRMMKDEPMDEKRHRRMLQKLKKGSTKPRGGGNQWEQFDYDLYSVNPGNNKKYISG